MFNITFVDNRGNVLNKDVTANDQESAEWLIKVLSPGATILETA
jgi:hypothetical protein